MTALNKIYNFGLDRGLILPLPPSGSDARAILNKVIGDKENLGDSLPSAIMALKGTVEKNSLSHVVSLGIKVLGAGVSAALFSEHKVVLQALLGQFRFCFALLLLQCALEKKDPISKNFFDACLSAAGNNRIETALNVLKTECGDSALQALSKKVAVVFGTRTFAVILDNK